MSVNGTAFGIASADPATILVLVGVNGDLFVHRSTDSGSTWLQPVWITSSSGPAAIAARGTDVDIVWGERSDVCYARSTNGGESFGPAVRAAPREADGTPRVARGSNGLVAVLVEQADVQVSVSTDGGSSFGPASTVAEGLDRHAEIAAGEGVVYVAYHVDSDLLVRRTLDAGASWEPPQTLDDVVYAGEYGERPSITADDSDAYVAYAVNDDETSYVRLRRTSSNGRDWLRPVALSPRADLRLYSHDPVITLDNGGLHVAYGRCNYWFEGRCDLGSCWSSDLVYRSSEDGVSWTRAEIAVVAPECAEADAIGLTVAERVAALYSWDISSGGGSIVTRAR